MLGLWKGPLQVLAFEEHPEFGTHRFHLEGGMWLDENQVREPGSYGVCFAATCVEIDMDSTFWEIPRPKFSRHSLGHARRQRGEKTTYGSTLLGEA